MDTITNAGGGATNLSFAQKIIATGLSVVLAVGLSPLGQVPAYADEGQQVVATQSDAPAISAGTLNEGLYITVATDLKYTGGYVVNATNPAVTQVRYIENNAYVPVDSSKYDIYYYSKADTTKAWTQIDEPGTYIAKVVITDDNLIIGNKPAKGTYNQAEFSVAAANIGGTNVTLTPSPSSPTYNGYTQPITWSGSYTYGTGDDEVYTLTQGTDFTASVSSVKNASSSNPITITGKGGFAGSTKNVNIVVGYAQFATDTTTDNGVKYGLQVGSKDVSHGNFGTITAEYGTSDDALGEVKFGGDPLVLGTDYTVSYKQTKDAAGNDVSNATSTDKQPTAKGTYAVTLTVGDRATNFSLTDGRTVTGTLEITGAVLSDENYTMTIADGTFGGGVAVAPAASDITVVKNSDKSDITSTLGTNYALTYEEWTAQDEFNLIGYKDYNDQYGTSYAKDATDVTVGYENASTAAVSSDKKSVSTSGDYKVTLTPTAGSSYSTEGSVSAKWTVNPAVATEGTAAGNLQITFPTDAVYNNDSSVQPTIYMLGSDGKPVTVVDPSDSTKTIPVDLIGNATVTFSQDGETVDNPAAAVGTYDAEIVFKDNLGGSTTITKAGALTVSPAPITDLAKSMTFAFDNDGNSATVYYTGNGLDITPTFSSEATAASDKIVEIPEGTEYTKTYLANSGTYDASGNPIAATTYRVTATFSGNYTGTLVANMTITPLALGQTTIEYLQEDGSYATDHRVAYTGSAIEPTYHVVVAEPNMTDKAEVASSVYAGTFSNNTNTGTANLSVAAASGASASGTQTSTFYITDSTFSSIGASVSLPTASSDYTAADQTFTFSVPSRTAGTLTPDTDYKVKVTDPAGDEITTGITKANSVVTVPVRNAGAYTVTVTGGTNLMYAGMLTATYTVNPITLEQADLKSATNADGTLTITPGTYTYNTNEQTANFTLTTTKAGASDTIALKADTDKAGSLYTVEGNKATDAGTYTATFTFEGNYTGTVTQQWTINPQIISDTAYVLYTTDVNPAKALTKTTGTTTTYEYSVPFTGYKQAPAIAVYNNSTKKAVEGLTYTVFYGNNDAANTQAGEASVSIVGTGNYTGTLDGYFEITAVELSKDNESISVDWGEELQYTGEELKPVPTITLTNADESTYELIEGVDYRIAYEGTALNAGDKIEVTIQGIGSFAGNNSLIEETLEVEKATQEITAPASAKVTYGKTTTIKVEGAKGALTVIPANGTGDVDTTVSGDTITIKGVKAGTTSFKVKVEATDNVDESNEVTVDVTVAKAKNSAFKVTAKTVKAKAKKVTKVNAKNAFTVKGQAGKVTYKKVKGAKKIAVAKNGKVTVKKGLKAGKTYKVKVKVTSAANTNYEAASKTVVLKVKVAK